MGQQPKPLWVLVVDDDPGLRQQLERHLQQLELPGVTLAAHSAPGQRSAERMMAAQTYDAVITDVRMETPQSGIELLQFMYAWYRADTLPRTYVHSSDPTTRFQGAEVDLESLIAEAFPFATFKTKGTHMLLSTTAFIECLAAERQ